MKFVLASASPRRKELMQLITPDFDIRPSDFDEAGVTASSPAELVALLASGKAKAVPYTAKETVIGCDTIVAVDNEVLGKPKDRDDAVRMMRLLSGRAHSVYTGVCVLHKGREYTFAEETKVIFFPLTEEEIDAYVATDEPYDKAGAYGIQGKAGLFVERIEGDYNNVVGFPVAKLNCLLNKLKAESL